MNVARPVPEDAATLHAEVSALLTATGPRPSCSSAEAALGALLAERWAGFCDTVHTEPFRCAPHAFLASVPVLAVCTLVADALLVGAPALAALLAGIGVVVLVAELLRYRELIDPLFPSAEGRNVVGVIRPSGPVRRRVLLTAHQDSAWEFNIWYWFGRAGPLVNVLGLSAGLVPLGVGLGAATGWLGADAVHLGALVAWGIAPVTALHLLFHTFRAVPGAMDDLAGLVVVTSVGRALAAERLADTEVVLLACSAEECGLRGAKRYAAAHALEHAAVPTIDVNVDGVYDERFLTVVTRELSTSVKHDPELVALAEAVAAALGHPMHRAAIPLGATDASAFAQAGLRTVSLLCQDTRSLAPNYHTRLDTLERVRPTSLVVMRDVVLGVVRGVGDSCAARLATGG